LGWGAKAPARSRFMELVVALAAALVAAVVAPALHRATPRHAGKVLALVPAGIAALLAMQVPLAGQPVAVRWSWLPQAGIDFALRADGLGLLFALLISGIGALVILYAGSYMQGQPGAGRLSAYLLLFMASMLGVALADDWITLFVAWELTSISSYFLIGHNHEEPRSRRNALQALLVTGAGGLALLAGLILLNMTTSAATLGDVVAAGPHAFAANAYATPILLLLLAGAFTKSAQFPFHFWLPNAMVAPTPVSAYLHSATMVKAGVFLIARIHPMASEHHLWVPLVATTGAATMLLGAMQAMRQKDLKLILAYTTVSALGGMTLLLGLGTVAGLAAALGFLLAHALYKGALFLIAGAVDHSTGTRDVTGLGGLHKAMPYSAGAALAAGLAFAGLPPLLGFIAKEEAFNAILAAGPHAPWLMGAFIVSLVLLVAAAGQAALRPFWGRLQSPQPPHEAPWPMLVGPTLLAGVGLFLGLFPGIVGPLLGRASGYEVQLALWHGWGEALLASIVTLTLGLALYLGVPHIRARWDRALKPLDRTGPERAFDGGLDGLMGFAKVQARWIQHGRLRGYVATTLLATTLAAGSTLILLGGVTLGTGWTDIRPHEALIFLTLVAAAATTPFLTSRAGSIALLGVVGYSVAVLFVLFGAPDLAMTQFLFETLSVLLFVLVLRHLPNLKPRSPKRTRWRDASIAVLVGALMTLLTLATTGLSRDSISSFFAQNSYPLAHGRNVVNVILVDFRSLDTLGEITVLAVAGLGVAALLNLRPRRDDA
jgi:multicomponent Na+:H+ antiporter subunit A